jgi:tRNA(Ile)-lysidine synthase
MPQSDWRDGMHWLRPWLRQPRSCIEDYVQAHSLCWVDDDSNADPRFARNRLRLAVWPALTQAFAQAEATLADSASWAQEADACLSELARDDLQLASDAKGLRLENWAALSPPRRANALRHWLAAQLQQPAPASLVTRLLTELGQPHALRWPTPQGELQRVGTRLTHFAAAPRRAKQSPALAREVGLRIQRAGLRHLPGWGGWLRVTRVAHGGVPLAWLMHAELRERQGGEQFQAGPGRPPRSLKKQYQAAGVPADLRGGPLIYSGGLLVFVPGLGLDARIVGPDGPGLVQLEWLTTRPD